MRQAIDPSSSNTIDLAGVRCAASPGTAVRAADDLGEFDLPQPLPLPEVPDRGEGVLLFDDFTDQSSGWRPGGGPIGYHGYHPDNRGSSYHVHHSAGEARDPWVVLRGVDWSDVEHFSVRTNAFRFTPLENGEGEAGQYEVGLVLVRKTTNDEGESEILGYIAFVVNPETDTWRVFETRDDGGPIQAEKSNRTKVESSGVDLSVEVRRPTDSSQSRAAIDFRIGSTLVTTSLFDDVGGDAGFYLGVLADDDGVITQKHLHFGEFVARDLS